jgi:hypothetical protein
VGPGTGNVTPYIGGGLGVLRAASGTYTEYIKAADTTGLVFLPSNTARLSIMDVSVMLYTNHVPLFAKSGTGATILEAAYW